MIVVQEVVVDDSRALAVEGAETMTVSVQERKGLHELDELLD